MPDQPNVIAVIPARMGSTRFPGKALASRTGRPLVLHVADAVRRVPQIQRVLVASEDEQIEQACRHAGVEHVMTASTHPNGSSRLAEVAERVQADVYLNVQGDEPEISIETIEATLSALQSHREAGVATAAAPIDGTEDPSDPNIVKVVRSSSGLAVRFTREFPENEGAYRHIGIYAYRPEVLRAYPNMDVTAGELSERLEQIRLLDHGIKIAVALVSAGHPGIDTPAQYDAFVARWNTEHSD
ncbi:MAG: 3-deoxy-manno-octulosonate cytidylyltransferase [Phycisphaerales bacterium]|nr:3-deoxy-manno-octulosonate cytidylyltransferase [Phycisphaerales bacterium]